MPCPASRSPVNLFYLTRSLRLLPPALARRVVVFPLAVGDGGAPTASSGGGHGGHGSGSRSGSSSGSGRGSEDDGLAFPLVQLFVERGNHGNTVVGTAATADGGCWSHVNGKSRASASAAAARAMAARASACEHRMRLLATRVPLARLDDLFPSGLGLTRLAKLDTQGGECRALEGARASLAASPSLGALVAEASAGLLAAQCCGRRWLLHLMHAHGDRWTVSCTPRAGPGGEATCTGRALAAAPSNVSALPRGVLGDRVKPHERKPLTLAQVEGLWRVCRKHAGADFRCDCDTFPRVARGLA